MISHIQLAGFKIAPVQVGNFQLTARRWLERRGDADHLIVVEIKSGYRIARLGILRLLFQADGAALGVELHHSIALRIFNLDRQRPSRPV